MNWNTPALYLQNRPQNLAHSLIWGLAYQGKTNIGNLSPTIPGITGTLFVESINKKFIVIYRQCVTAKNWVLSRVGQGKVQKRTAVESFMSFRNVVPNSFSHNITSTWQDHTPWLLRSETKSNDPMFVLALKSVAADNAIKRRRDVNRRLWIAIGVTTCRQGYPMEIIKLHELSRV